MAFFATLGQYLLLSLVRENKVLVPTSVRRPIIWPKTGYESRQTLQERSSKESMLIMKRTLVGRCLELGS